MSVPLSAEIATERTDQGEQVLVPSVAPISQRQRLECLMAAPLRPMKAQKPLNIGLFDEDARNQLALF
jgi:hypothetical protein